MRVLIDTNIFIYREDNKEISSNLQKLTRLLNEQKISVIIHPISLEEIEKNKNETQKQILKSKILAYPVLESPPDPNNDLSFLSRIKKPGRINDRRDNVILYSLYRNAVTFFITEDRGIHRNAKKLHVDNRVLSIEDAIEIFESQSQKHDVIAPIALRLDAVHNLDIHDPFFDSLKKNYPEFEKLWFPKICLEGRKCFINTQNDQIGALLIYNIEEHEGINNSDPPLPVKRRLKLCTLKVTHNGQKIGELFINLAIQIAIKNEIAEIYLTLFEGDNERLIDLLIEFGFEKYGKKTNGEDIYLKQIIGNQNETESLTPLDFDKKYYPSFYDGPKVRKFIVPIHPEFFERLFTNLPERQTGLLEHSGNFYPEGNAIKKAYISRTNSKKIHPGDILLFYQTTKNQAITTLGIVEEIYFGISNSETILGLVAKRTVYSKEEIERMQKPVTVIFFKYHFHFRTPITYIELTKERLIEAAPQSISILRHKDYRQIKKIGELDERFAFG
ncbi:MAG: PIN domain-containing protein [Methanoregula sp.]